MALDSEIEKVSSFSNLFQIQKFEEDKIQKASSPANKEDKPTKDIVRSIFQAF